VQVLYYCSEATRLVQMVGQTHFSDLHDVSDPILSDSNCIHQLLLYS